MNNKVNFIFFGRLTKEKWFDLILDIVEKYKYNENVNFWIFGKWDKYFEDKIKIISARAQTWKTNIAQETSNIKYFGWQDQNTIKDYLWKAHYCLMPSRFLETFGLSALESINQWVPVIWFAKWWLEQFILENFDISRQDWQNNFEKLDKIIKSIIENQNNEEYQRISDLMIEKSKNYSKENWIQNFEKISGKNKKVLMLSDYIENIGGIENYISDTSELLSQNWHKVDKFWLSGKIVKYRKFLMPLVWLNIFAYFWLRKKIKEFDPDIIWIHSASRYLWWLPLLNCKWKKNFMMYHDLWYFHPYPSRVYEEEQITKFSLMNFIKQANTNNPIKLIWVWLKFLSILILKKVLLKTVDSHLIPSDFMKGFLRNWGVGNKRIVVLKHFGKN